MLLSGHSRDGDGADALGQDADSAASDSEASGSESNHSLARDAHADDPDEDAPPAPFDVMLACYTLFERDSQQQRLDRSFLRSWQWSHLVLDEAHAVTGTCCM